MIHELEGSGGGGGGERGAKEKIIEFTSCEEDERFNQNPSAQVGVIKFRPKGLVWATFAAWQIIASRHVWHFAVPFRASQILRSRQSCRLDTLIPQKRSGLDRGYTCGIFSNVFDKWCGKIKYARHSLLSCLAVVSFARPQARWFTLAFAGHTTANNFLNPRIHLNHSCRRRQWQTEHITVNCAAYKSELCGLR